MGHLRSVATITMEDVSFDFEAEIDAKDALRKASLKAEGNISSENAAARGRHSIVCKHWLRNLCMKGDKCDFLHQYDPNKMPECTFWLKYGKCNDPECVFRHVANSERPECQRYRLGFCKYGPMCRSRHDRLGHESLPELLPDWFLDSLILNSNLVPRAEDVNLTESGSGRDRPRNGTSGDGLALVPLAPETEQGTIPGLLPPIHGKCRYFIVRSVNVRNIQISASKGIWATSHGNCNRLRQGFQDVDHVILIFAATESRMFNGYGKMFSEPDDRLFPGIWGEMSNRLSSNFRVHWIKQCSAPFGHAAHIKNPQNDDLPVMRCRDGQDLPSSVGERLCRFLWQQANVDLLRGTDLEFEPRTNYLMNECLLPSPRENTFNGGEIIKPTEVASKANAGAVLALEDVKKDTGEPDDARARPAPAPMGTFQRDGPEWKQVRTTSGPPPVTVGKALASGSSSLLAAMAEEQRHGGPPPVWPGGPPPPGWRPPPGLEHQPPDWMPGRFPHPPGYYPPPFRPLFPFPGAAQPQAGPPPPAGVHPPPGLPGTSLPEVRPPGFWGDRNRCSQPPAGWEGASSAPAVRDSQHRRSREQSRSRSRRRRRSRH